MSNERQETKKFFFKMPENFAELSDEELENMADQIITNFLSGNQRD